MKIIVKRTKVIVIFGQGGKRKEKERKRKTQIRKNRKRGW